MRRLLKCRSPLIHTGVGRTTHGHTLIRPRLPSNPLDQVVGVDALLGDEDEAALRLPGATRISDGKGIAMLDPVGSFVSKIRRAEITSIGRYFNDGWEPSCRRRKKIVQGDLDSIA